MNDFTAKHHELALADSALAKISIAFPWAITARYAGCDQ
jgi:hypothetical protein